MSVSANSIIHYTKEFERLKGIIDNGFRVKYCLESFLHADKSKQAAYPMVSFCDLPLSQVKLEHLKAYGNYGIGLKKEWAKKSGLNPVLYIDDESTLGSCIYNQALTLSAVEKELQVKVLYDLIYTYSYTKRYEGLLEREDFKDENYKFYNEREWRFVPTKKQVKEARTYISGDEYIKNKADYNKSIENVYLEFSFSDISYFIVSQEEEIPKLLDHVHKKYQKLCSSFDLDILKTKILTAKQIIEDF